MNFNLRPQPFVLFTVEDSSKRRRHCATLGTKSLAQSFFFSFLFFSLKIKIKINN